MVDALASSSATATPANPTATLAADFDTFLALLTTQLENQDPLSPMEAEKFTEQLVQFSSVEQQMQTNTQLTQLVSMMRDAETTAALDYLGQNVTVAGSSLHLPVNGETGGTYTLPSEADRVAIEIRNETGQLIAVLDGDEKAGTHSFSWDGLNANGVRMDAGVYSVEVSASDKEGNPIDTELVTGGIVEGIETSDDGLFLLVNGIATPISAIRSINRGDQS